MLGEQSIVNLKRKKILVSKKLLSPISEKLKARSIEYSRVRKEYLFAKGYTCEVCGNAGDQIHHKAKRGKNLCAVETFMCVCALCHSKIHDNPKWARDNGYLIYEFK